jgi:hypothetical protein
MLQGIMYISEFILLLLYGEHIINGQVAKFWQQYITNNILTIAVCLTGSS